MAAPRIHSCVGYLFKSSSAVYLSSKKLQKYWGEHVKRPASSLQLFPQKKKTNSVTLPKWQKPSVSQATSNHLSFRANRSPPWCYHWMDGSVPTSLCHQAHSLLVSLICPSPFSLSPSLTHPPPFPSFSSTHPVHPPSISLFSSMGLTLINIWG